MSFGRSIVGYEYFGSVRKKRMGLNALRRSLIEMNKKIE